MKTLLTALTLLVSSATFAETTATETTTLSTLPSATVEVEIPEVVVLGANLQINLAEQREQLKREISISHARMIELFNKDLEISPVTLDVDVAYQTEAL